MQPFVVDTAVPYLPAASSSQISTSYMPLIPVFVEGHGKFHATRLHSSDLVWLPADCCHESGHLGAGCALTSQVANAQKPRGMQPGPSIFCREGDSLRPFRQQWLTRKNPDKDKSDLLQEAEALI